MLLNQPHKIQIGNILKEYLVKNQGEYKTFYLIVAYVKESGVAHLKESIEKFRASGGRVKAIVGIDQQNTSAQGLRLLLPLCDEVWVFHNESPVFTFHPKCYAFENPGKRAVVIVGSSNLTEGGLYTNYEACILSEYDLTQGAHLASFSEFLQMFDNYSKKPIMSKSLDGKLIDALLAENYITDEAKPIPTSLPSQSGVERTKRTSLFGTETVSAPTKTSIIRRVPKPLATVQQVPLGIIPVTTTKPSLAPIPVTKGGLLWAKKKLPSSDVQDVKIGTAPTGGLRLTQAQFRHLGAIIDQTTYFRQIVFAGLAWREEKSQPFVEVADVLFDITINGRNIGQHRLQIRHKPSGEADQGNYTTLISWGEISSIIRDSSLTGKDLFLFGPPAGKREPYFIEIK